MGTKHFTLLSFALCVSLISYGQSISGTINTYTAVSGITNSGCNTCGNAACYSEITVASSAGYVAGGTALIIQMKGAVIDESNSTSFGNISNNNNTGNFEFANIISVPTGTTVRVRTLTQTYSTSTSVPAGITQLVTVPVYAGDVTVSGVLTCTAWDGTTGGVLAFIAGGKVIMNANINVSGRGFRGSVHHEASSGVCTEDRYFLSNATESDRGALKGEGVALTVVNKERGRGKQANGGGGGIGHNGGGGGGGNGGAGGYGGKMYTGCANIWGRGDGGSTFAASSTRVVMGGGGGAGDSNGTGAADPGGTGTNGGGIVIISAASVENPTHLTAYSGTMGPNNNLATEGYFSNSYTHLFEVDVFCQLTLNSVVVNAQAAQTVTIQLRAPDKTTVLQSVSVAVPAGVSTVPVGLTITPARGYFIVASGTGSLRFVGNVGAYPYTVTDIISIKRCEPNPGNNNIPYLVNWNVTSLCTSGGYKINASGINNPFAVTSDGGGGGGGGGSIYIKANSYTGRINLIAKGGEGAEMLDGGCHAPGAGGGGGYICTSIAPPANVNRNVSGGAPGEIPDSKASCWVSPTTGYNSHGATKGDDGIACTNLSLITNPCVLPVEFISFKGWKEESINLLEWMVATEKNNNYFSIERSSNGTDFTSIGNIKGKGNSSTMQAYKFYDDQPFNSVNYYRLKQVDYDGSFAYSNTIAIVNRQLDINIYPNPGNGTFSISFLAPNQPYKLDITDINGRIVYAITDDSTPENLEVNGLSNGIYIVRFYPDNHEVVFKKLVVY